MSLELSINLEFLQSLEPPACFPPTEEELTVQIENKFLSECQRFIVNQRMLYKCSKAIQLRLKSIIKNTESIVESLSSNHSKLTAIANQLAKHKHQDLLLRQREKILNLLCELIKMEDLRKDLLIHQPTPQTTTNPLNPLNPLNPTNPSSPIDEQEYLARLDKLNTAIQHSAELAELSTEFMVVREIILELESILKLAVEQIVKKYMTPRMVQLALTKYSHIFFSNSNSNGVFASAVVGNRIQSMKISLNPMINNLNYATNIPELYQSILTTWLRLIQQERTLFAHSQQFALLHTVNRELITDLIPRMEKNIFRIKELVAVVRIRKYFYDFWNLLKGVEGGKGGEQVVQSSETMMLNVLMKCEAVIQSQLGEQSSKLQSSKYNIYTLVSYIPIRQHLEKVKLCYQFSLENEQIDWEMGFFQLFSSRDPTKHPNNKSLLIFNLNIWYLYLKIIPAGKHRTRGHQLLASCYQSFTNINIQETNKKYYEAFEKLLQIGGNVTAFKNCLYAEIHLLGHEELRLTLAARIRQKYLEYYGSLLEKLEKRPMNNEQVKAYCSAKKINLNKFGKYSHSICIYSTQELQSLLAYH